MNYLEVESMADPTGWVLWVSGQVQDPDPLPWNRYPVGSRHHGQTQRKIKVQRTDPEKDRGTYDIIYIQKINDAYFDYTWKFGTEGPGPGTRKSGSKDSRVRPWLEPSGAGLDQRPKNVFGLGWIQSLEFSKNWTPLAVLHSFLAANSYICTLHIYISLPGGT